MIYVVIIAGLGAFAIAAHWLASIKMPVPQAPVEVTQEQVQDAMGKAAAYYRANLIRAYSEGVVVHHEPNPHSDLEFDFREAPAESWGCTGPSTPQEQWEWDNIPMTGRNVDEFMQQFEAWMQTPQGQFAAYIARKEGV